MYQMRQTAFYVHFCVSYLYFTGPSNAHFFSMGGHGLPHCVYLIEFLNMSKVNSTNHKISYKFNTNCCLPKTNDL